MSRRVGEQMRGCVSVCEWVLKNNSFAVCMIYVLSELGAFVKQKALIQFTMIVAYTYNVIDTLRFVVFSLSYTLCMKTQHLMYNIDI